MYMRGDANHILDLRHTWFGVGRERSRRVACGANVDGKDRSDYPKEVLHTKRNHSIIIEWSSPLIFDDVPIIF